MNKGVCWNVRPDPRLLNHSTSGPLEAHKTTPGVEKHGWNKKHQAYNAKVKDLFTKWLNGRDLNDVKAEEIGDFVDNVLGKSKDADILGFKKEVEIQAGRSLDIKSDKATIAKMQRMREMGAGKVAGKSAKALGKIAAPIFFIKDWAEGGFEHAVREATWPASEAVPESND